MAKKDAKATAKTSAKPSSSSGGKAKKKKWSKGKVKDKANNAVLFDKAAYEKLYKEVPSYKLITPAVLIERLRINGSLARRAIRELRDKGEIVQISNHASQMIYSKFVNLVYPYMMADFIVYSNGRMDFSTVLYVIARASAVEDAEKPKN